MMTRAATAALTGSKTIANVTDNGGLTVDGSLDVTSALNAVMSARLIWALAGSSRSPGDRRADGDGFEGASQLVVDNAALFGTGVWGI